MAKRMLVIENDAYILNCIQLVFNTEGYQVLGDSSAARIGEQILHFKPDIILLDIVSVGGEKSEALRFIKLHPNAHSIPVLLISCLSGLKVNPGLKEEKILLKPLDLNTLIKRVNEVVS